MNILDFRMRIPFVSNFRNDSAPKCLKGWHVIILTVGLLWIYREALGYVSDCPSNWPAWLTWFSLTVVFTFKTSIAVAPAFSPVHTFARASAGATALVALSSISILYSGFASSLSLLILIALAISFYFVSGLVISVRSPNVIDNIKGRSCAQSLDVWLPIGLGAVVMRDFRIIRFSLWQERRPKSDSKDGTVLFSNHFVARPMLIALLAIAVVELVVGHILLRSLSTWISITHLVFGAFFILYVVGIIRSFTALPTMVEYDLLRIRMSVFFEAVTPVSNIRAVSRISTMPANKNESEQIANAAIVVAPNILVELMSPVQVERLFKGASSATAIALYVDNPEKFLSCLERAG